MRFVHRLNLSGANHGEIAVHLLPDDRAVVQRRNGRSEEFDHHDAALESAGREATIYPENDSGSVYVILHGGTEWPEHLAYQLEA